IERGITFSINESYLNNTKLAGLLEKVSIISVDVKRLNESIVEFARRNSKTLLVSRIESEEEFNKAREVGNYFQGNYLETPFILKELRSAPYLKHTLLKIMAIIHSAQSTKEIANIISTDVGMSAKILRLVNSAYYSPIKEIKSVEQACALLGLKNLRNFLLVLAMNDHVSIENPELWKKSLIRALIAQRIAKLIYPQYESEAYLMGFFSLIDEILGVDKIAFLKDINVGQEIIDGYTGKNAQLRSILDCSIALEKKLPEFLNMQGFIQNDIIANLEKLTGLSGQTLIDIAKSAFELADQILKI
ncbi:MAG: HDOD domain-containing protein, partial [Aquificaceae bacterium]